MDVQSIRYVLTTPILPVSMPSGSVLSAMTISDMSAKLLAPVRPLKPRLVSVVVPPIFSLPRGQQVLGHVRMVVPFIGGNGPSRVLRLKVPL
jgi:hypothetical protein